jgi:hypothetical protein
MNDTIDVRYVEIVYADAMDERTARLESLLARLEDARARLGASDDAASAADVLGELHDLSQELAAEIDRERRAHADADERDDAQLGLL